MHKKTNPYINGFENQSEWGRIYELWSNINKKTMPIWKLYEF